MSDAFAPAHEPTDALRALYDDYVSEKTLAENSQSWGSRIFGNLLTSGASRSAESIDTEFFDGAEKLCARLSQLLSQQTAEEAERLALSAAETLLFYPCDELCRSTALAITACESLFSPLLVFIGPSARSALRQRYLSKTPKRMMLPAQRSLLLEMELDGKE